MFPEPAVDIQIIPHTALTLAITDRRITQWLADIAEAAPAWRLVAVGKAPDPVPVATGVAIGDEGL
jgi:hypothetical protein